MIHRKKLNNISEILIHNRVLFFGLISSGMVADKTIHLNREAVSRTYPTFIIQRQKFVRTPNQRLGAGYG